MIVNFTVQNFGSIKDKQILSFEADNTGHLEEYYIIHPIEGLRLLKLGLIYGANASGKTTILKALSFLREIVLSPESMKTESLGFEPFLFDLETPKQNSILSIEFIQNSIRYYYEVEFNKRAIVKEELNSYESKKANVFKRFTDEDKQFAEVKFGSRIKMDKSLEKSIELNTLWNNTVLGGFLKTNIEIKELKEVTDWFSKYLKPIVYTRTELNNYVSNRIENSEISKEDIINILKKADLNISDILIKKEDVEDHNDFADSNSKLSEVKVKPKISLMKLNFEHTVNLVKYNLPFEKESNGTKRFYGFAGLLSLLIKNSVLFPIDELESSLHPDLFVHFLLSFLVNSRNSQLIATTHNREILNNKDIFRNDAIWFTDKSDCCATELYSLSDFDSSVIRDTSNVYNAYKIGKLGGVPSLGDIYLDLYNEKE